MPVLGPGPVVLGSSFVTDGAKKREREDDGGVGKPRKGGKWKRWEGGGHRQGPRGGSWSSLLVPPAEPHPHPSFQFEHPESDSTKPPVRHWETAALPPGIETRGFPARSMMGQK